VRGTEPNPFPAQVINMSLGGDGKCPDAEREDIDYARSRNAVVAAAASNQAEDTGKGASQLPWRHHGELASYSNFGNEVAIAAPGGETSSIESGRRSFHGQHE
jgi:serine protease